MTTPDLHQFWQQTLSDWQALGPVRCGLLQKRVPCLPPVCLLAAEADRQRGAQQSCSSSIRIRSRGPDAGAGLTVSLPGGISITGLHTGSIELLGAMLRQL